MNQADDMCFVELIERILKRTPGTLGGVTFPPGLFAERPANFETWPTRWVEEADTSDKFTCRFLFHCPNAGATPKPKSE
jgi:hypothetical protein